MKLSDALAHLRSVSDQTHKFWGYYQVVTAAAIGFAWASSKPSKEVIYGLVAAYAIFALLNCRLIFLSQSAARKVWKAIRNYEPLPDEVINPGLLPIVRLNKPDKPKFVAGMHIALSIAAATAMLARTHVTDASSMQRSTVCVCNSSGCGLPKGAVNAGSIQALTRA